MNKLAVSTLSLLFIFSCSSESVEVKNTTKKKADSCETKMVNAHLTGLEVGMLSSNSAEQKSLARAMIKEINRMRKTMKDSEVILKIDAIKHMCK